MQSPARVFLSAPIRATIPASSQPSTLSWFLLTTSFLPFPSTFHLFHHWLLESSSAFICTEQSWRPSGFFVDSNGIPPLPGLPVFGSYPFSLFMAATYFPSFPPPFLHCPLCASFFFGSSPSTIFLCNLVVTSLAQRNIPISGSALFKF